MAAQFKEISFHFKRGQTTAPLSQPIMPAMFSYRHAYHAGNHADVLKHLCLIALLDYLTQKDKSLLAIDTHAGIGRYSLSAAEARTSGEAEGGILRLRQFLAESGQAPTPAVARYLEVLDTLGTAKHYPGSPWLMQHLLRLEADAAVPDQLHLCELNAKDARLLQENLAELPAAARIRVQTANGFAALKALLPPPSRRGLVLMDPSYEMKTDYGEVARSMEDALKRFATGCYAVWYPIVGRPEAHELPRRLKRIAAQAGKNWLHATLSVGSDDAAAQSSGQLKRSATGRYVASAAAPQHKGLRASGMFIINPPFVLAEQLQAALPQLQAALGQGVGEGHLLEASA